MRCEVSPLVCAVLPAAQPAHWTALPGHFATPSQAGLRLEIENNNNNQLHQPGHSQDQLSDRQLCHAGLNTLFCFPQPNNPFVPSNLDVYFCVSIRYPLQMPITGNSDETKEVWRSALLGPDGVTNPPHG